MAPKPTQNQPQTNQKKKQPLRKRNQPQINPETNLNKP